MQPSGSDGQTDSPYPLTMTLRKMVGRLGEKCCLTRCERSPVSDMSVARESRGMRVSSGQRLLPCDLFNAININLF